jgi:hypothetical protein
MNEYNNPSFATMFQRAVLNTCITICFGLIQAIIRCYHIQNTKCKLLLRIKHYCERRIVVLIHCYMRNRIHSPIIKKDRKMDNVKNCDSYIIIFDKFKEL